MRNDEVVRSGTIFIHSIHAAKVVLLIQPTIQICDIGGFFCFDTIRVYV